MPKLVIISKRVLNVGEYYKGLSRGPYREPRPEQAFKVIAISTQEEYLECMVSFGAEKAWEEMLCEMNGPWNFYEIQTD